MAITDYESRDMLEVLRQVPSPDIFFSNLLVGQRITHSTKNINMDRVGGNRLSARYTNRVGGSNKIGRSGHNNIPFVAPYVCEEYEITPSDLDERTAGQTQFEVDPAANEAEMLDSGLEKLSSRLDVLEERQIIESITTGELEVDGDGVNYTIDYDMPAANLPVLATTAEWDETTSTKLDDLHDWVKIIRDSGAPPPTMAIGDQLAMNMLIQDTAVLNYLDNKGLDIGKIVPRYDPKMAATYLGNLMYTGVNLNLIAYEGVYDYLDDDGDIQTTNYLPENTIILLSPSMRYEFHYGKIENFKAPGFRGARFPLLTEDDKGKSKCLQMESSPLPGFLQPKAVVSATVITPT